jgi:PAS domain S-box-containing protein
MNESGTQTRPPEPLILEAPTHSQRPGKPTPVLAPRPRRISAWLPALAGVAGLSLAIVMWQLLVRAESEQIRYLSETHARSAAAKLGGSLQALAAPLAGVAQRQGSALRQDRPWDITLTGLVAAMWVEPGGRVGWVTPRDGNEALVNSELAAGETDRSALMRAEETGRPSVTSEIALPQGGPGFRLVIPVRAAGRSEGFLVGVFSTAAIYSLVFKDDLAEHWIITVFQDGRELWRNGAASDVGPPAESEAKALGSTFRVRAAAGPEILSRLQSRLPVVVLATGVVIALLLAASLHLAQAARRRAAEAQESRQHYQALAESLPHLVWTCLSDGRCDYLSRQWVEYTGRPAEEQLGDGWAEQVHPDDRADVQAAWARATERRETYDLEFRIRRADGVFRWFKTRAVPLRDSAGLVVKWFGSNTDVEDYKQAQQKLQSQLARLGLLDQTARAIGERQDLQSILQVVLGTLEDHLPIDFGVIATHEEGGSALEVICVGAKSRTLALEMDLPERSRISDEKSLARCMQGELTHEPDTRLVDLPFAKRLAQAGLYSLVMSPLVVEGRTFGVLIAARRGAGAFSSGDCEFLNGLSGHVALAAHQAKLHGALEHAYEDLRQTQQAVMQQERLRALGEMASGIAHDINNAISPVALYTESLLEKEPGLSDRARGYLEIIQRAIQDVAHTVGRMREFYRHREAHVPLAPVDLNVLIQQVAALTRARWNDMPQERGTVINFTTDLQPRLPAVMGVESEIRDALVNLVFNAIDAMPRGGTLTLRTKSSKTGEPPRGSTESVVYVEVSDTGVGMDEITRRRCLEPFFSTKGDRGTGLGLAMVYGMVQRHGGEIDLESAPGTGTTIRLILPVAAAAAAPVDRTAPRGVATPRLRLLVVDDDPLVLEALQDTLEAEGHAVVVANQGQAGIDTFLAAQGRGESFQAVFTDLGMPQVDGRRVARAVKAASPSTPVFLLTGWGQRLLAEGDIPDGVDRVLSKPPKIAQLRQALADHFG